ncbi:MAG: TonB-dependent receptor [Pseudomonadota bacterium]
MKLTIRTLCNTMEVFPGSPVYINEHACWSIRFARSLVFFFLIALACSAFTQAEEEARLWLDIPEQGLDRSLTALAKAIDGQTLFPFEEISRLDAPSITGEFTATAALHTLLKGTGYVGQINDKRVIVVRPQATAGSHRENATMVISDGVDRANSGASAKRAGGLMASVLAAFFSPSGTAQPSANDTPAVIEEIIVTATRRESGIQDTAMSINAISGDTLNQNVYTTIGQVLDAVPGVTAFDSGPARNRVIIRNIATSTQEEGGATTATYFDDFPITADVASVPTLRLVDLDRVEVLKGPQGTLFGRSAMGGIVRYMPNKPDMESLPGGLNGYISDTTDGGNNAGGYGYLNVPLGETLALRAVGYSYQHDGWIDNVELDEDNFNEEDTVGLRLALRWEPSDDLTIDATYVYQEMEAAIGRVSTLRDPANTPEGKITPADPESRQIIGGVLQSDNSDFNIFNVNAEYRFDSFSANFIATRIDEEYRFVDDQREFVGITNGCVCDGVVGPTGSDTETDVLEVRLVSTGDRRLDWIVGAFYEDIDNDLIQRIEYLGSGDLLFGSIPVPEATGRTAVDILYRNPASETAVYGELSYKFTDRTRATVGYRRSDVEFATEFAKTDGFFLVFQGDTALQGETFSVQEDVDTYKLSLEHDLNDDVLLYATASSGYRRGGFNRPTALNPFSTYDSDTLWSYEAGVKSTWLDGRLVANAAAFFLDWDDIQLVVQDPITFNRITQNVGEAEIPGFEFSVAAQLTPEFSLTAGGSFTSPELQDDVPGGVSGMAGDGLPGAAEENFSLTANWERSLDSGWDVFASGVYRYVGDRLNDFNEDLDVELPSYELLDLRLGVASPRGYSASLFAHNVFDEAATLFIDRAPGFEYIPTTQPRTIGLNLTYDF